MSSSKPEEALSGDQAQTEILIDDMNEEKNDVPHGGKKIDKYVFSPNMQCIATLSTKDKSIIVWTITKNIINELNVKNDSSLNDNDLELALNTDKKSDFKFEGLFSSTKLVGISDCKQVIIKLYANYFNLDFAIIDSTTKLRQILNAQVGLVEWAHDIAFLENGDLAIVKGDPVYRAYIFSKSNSNGKHKWTCKNSIELEKFYRCFISKKGKLFMCFGTPFVISQWDLITQKFDVQYILNWDLKRSDFLGLQIELNSDITLLAMASCMGGISVVYIYLTKSGMMSRYDQFPCDIYPATYENYKSLGIITSDYIIDNNNNYLSIQRLSRNESWKKYLKRKEYYDYDNIYTYFSIKETKEFIQVILNKYKDKDYESNQFLIQNCPDESGIEPWIIEYKKGDHGYQDEFFLSLGAQIKSENMSRNITIRNFPSYSGNIFEKTVLKNGDILLIFPSCILIYTLKEEKGELIIVGVMKIVFNKKKNTPKHSIIRLLTSFIDNFGFEILPPPTHSVDVKSEHAASQFVVIIKDSTSLKLYGKDIFESILKLKEFNKNKRFTEKFLSKNDMLIPHINLDRSDFERYIHRKDDSLLFNLQHCGTYVNSLGLHNTLFFNHLFVWISKICNSFKKSYPQIYHILSFPYLLYSSYISVYPQETVLLIFPLLNFAAYSKKYSYSELFYLQDNPFTYYWIHLTIINGGILKHLSTLSGT
ncbi:hypothetical protein F8M41_006009 [Gigaspora margarita]|uniref:Uncharacterized protein n=1 Tax=Gigaspora margarita TaxID=4874 RepID=A0A8H4A6D8_GIGMA|nr:hypothetical protein F8M41_006009 [Gigaspora margarita]